MHLERYINEERYKVKEVLDKKIIFIIQVGMKNGLISRQE
jgi:hypothetical protein